MKFGKWVWAGLFLALSAGCGLEKNDGVIDQTPAQDRADIAGVQTPADLLTPIHVDDHAGHDHTFGVRKLILDTKQQPGDIPSEGSTHITFDAPIMQIGLWLDGDAPESLELRTKGLDGVWSSWSGAEITWSEGYFHVGRAILTEPAIEIEFRGGASLTNASAEFYNEVVAHPERLAVDLPLEQDASADLQHDAGDLRTRGQAVAPASLVASRAQWGARSPNKVCGSVVAPYRVSIHHTAGAGDSGDPEGRMRQIQAFHMDSRGWCDIGYHFVVSQSGNNYQGRSDERRPGAHVGNQNAGNIGISFMGNFENIQPTQPQLDAAAELMAWIKETYDVPWNRSSVRGHQEWPGQSTACPGKNLLPKVDSLMQQAANGGAATTYDIPVKVTWVDGTSNMHEQGSGANIADIFPGQKFQAAITVTNNNDQPLRGVKLKYLVETPHIVATNYTIQTDHPAKDKQSWMTNDADSAPENPAKDALGKTGELTMHAFGAGETKRVLIDLEAKHYSVGAIDHPDVRGWIKHIDDVYGEQDEWNQDPAVKKTEGLLQGYAQIDVLSYAEWQFDGGEEDDTEGWSTCEGASIDEFKTSATTGSLASHASGDTACVQSPAWTKIDAGLWDQLVLRTRSHDGEHTKAIYWARAGQQFSEDRVVYYKDPGNGEFNPIVLPMRQHPEWQGEITALRIDLLKGEAPGAEASGWHDIDAIFLQSSQESETNSRREEFVSVAPVALVNGDSGNDGDGDVVVDPDPGDIDPGSDSGQDPGMGNMEDTGDTQIAVNNGGCSATGAGERPVGDGSWLLLIAGGLILARRRRALRER